jgi:hypothetical protein
MSSPISKKTDFVNMMQTFGSNTVHANRKRKFLKWSKSKWNESKIFFICFENWSQNRAKRTAFHFHFAWKRNKNSSEKGTPYFVHTLPRTIEVEGEYLHAGHLSAGWIGPVSWYRDQTDLPVALILGLQVGRNGQQTSVLSLHIRYTVDCRM